MIHNRINPNGKPEFELFDHRRDPLNLKDVAAENPEVVRKLAQEIDVWHKAAEAARLDSGAVDEQKLGRGGVGASPQPGVYSVRPSSYLPTAQSVTVNPCLR